MRIHPLDSEDSEYRYAVGRREHTTVHHHEAQDRYRDEPEMFDARPRLRSP